MFKVASLMYQLTGTGTYTHYLVEKNINLG